MQRLLNWFRNGSASSQRPAKRASSFRPRLEALEEREVLSTASAAPHAVMQSNGQSAVFYINQSDHAFYEADRYGPHRLSGPGTVQKFSAGLDVNGNAQVFVQAGDNAFWQWSKLNPGGWLKLANPNQVGDFAAVKNGRAWAQMADGSINEYVQFVLQGYHTGALQQAGPGTVDTSYWGGVLDAVTDGSGKDAVFYLASGNVLRELYNNPYTDKNTYTNRYVDNGDLPGFSAGTDQYGRADVYMVGKWSHSFYRWDDGALTKLYGSGLVTQFSATDNGQVLFLSPNGQIDKFDGNNHLQANVNNGAGNFTSLSAAASNDVFAVNWDNTLYELHNSSWKTIDYPVQSS